MKHKGQTAVSNSLVAREPYKSYNEILAHSERLLTTTTLCPTRSKQAQKKANAGKDVGGGNRNEQSYYDPGRSVTGPSYSTSGYPFKGEESNTPKDACRPASVGVIPVPERGN